MNKSVMLFIVFGGIVAATIVYLSKTKSPTLATSPAVSSVTQATAPAAPEKISSPNTDAPPPLVAATTPTPVVPAAPVAASAMTGASASPIHKAVDNLLSAHGLDKHNLFQQLIKSGQIDAAIAELQQRAAQNPNDPEIPTTLGEAQLNKLRDLRDSGSGDYNQIGILAMQADQSFNSALKLDPQNWEAQFVKNSSMYSQTKLRILGHGDATETLSGG